MASRWRRRRVCTLVVDGRGHKVALRDISGTGARIDTDLDLLLGRSVELHHPDMGAIVGSVSEIREGGASLRFDGNEAAVAFALGAIAADMTIE